MKQHIYHSNLIEGIDSEEEDRRSMRAWEWALDNIDIMFTARGVLEVHRQITLKQLPASERGRWRKVPVWVGNHTPPAPALVPSLMSQYLESMSLAYETLDPKTMHIQFEKIHPFIDGNGRTGRMLMWVHEIRIGREPTFINNETKNKAYGYYDWFRLESKNKEI